MTDNTNVLIGQLSSELRLMADALDSGEAFVTTDTESRLVMPRRYRVAYVGAGADKEAVDGIEIEVRADGHREAK